MSEFVVFLSMLVGAFVLVVGVQWAKYRRGAKCLTKIGRNARLSRFSD